MSSATLTTNQSTFRSWGALGIIAPLLFTVSAITNSLVRADHSLRTDPVSALAAGPDGWIQNLTFIVTGLLLLGFAWGMHLALGRTDRLDMPGLLLAVFALGLMGAGFFPAIDSEGAFTEDRTAHVIAGLLTFASAGLAGLALAGPLRREPGWKDLAGYVRVVGISLTALFVAGGILVRPAEAPFHDYLGLFQWIFLAVWFSCLIVLGYRLTRAKNTVDR